MTVTLSGNRQLFERASAIVPGGVHSNARARLPYPLYFRRAEGPYLFDVDGDRYTDFVCGNGAIILGHNHSAVTSAVQEALEAGVTVGSETPLAVQAAELFLELVATAEMVRFANSGTEAVTHALEISRAATGRRRVAKVEGAYHGWSSEMYVSAWPDIGQAGPADRPEPVFTHQGVDPDQSSRTLILPFNNVAALETILEEHGPDLAAVIVEPVLMDIGYIEATREYIDALRRLTTKHGIVLIFDELLTGFRVARGGAQEFYGVTPDLSTFGKAIANGFPLACVAGRQDLMMTAGPGGTCAWVGTFNAHAISMAAAVGTLTTLRDEPVWSKLQALTQYLEDQFNRRATERGIPGGLRGRGGNFHWYFVDGAVTDYRSAAHADAAMHASFAGRALDRQLWVSPGALSHHTLTLAHETQHIDWFCDCLE
jgi:glutamate-1-semialdehyde 2,1-aminomutase